MFLSPEMLDQYVPFECIKRFGNLFKTFVASQGESTANGGPQRMQNRNIKRRSAAMGIQQCFFPSAFLTVTNLKMAFTIP
jgi:hypothetical protein